MVMRHPSHETWKTCKMTGVSASRDVGDEIVCAAMRVHICSSPLYLARRSVSILSLAC